MPFPPLWCAAASGRLFAFPAAMARMARKTFAIQGGLKTCTASSILDESWKGAGCRKSPAIGLFLDPRIV
jgi:hypothetical protein